MLTLEQIKNNGWLIFEVITGSRAYGLDTAKSWRAWEGRRRIAAPPDACG